MKSRYLFAILVGLLVFTYYFEEIGSQKREQFRDDAITLFKPEELGELKKITTKRSGFYQRSGLFYTAKDNRLVDQKKLNQFLGLLSHIKIKRKLETNDIIKREKEFFPHQNDFFHFSFEKQNLKFVLGNKLEFDTAFYMKIEKEGKSEYFVAFDSSALDQAYKTEEKHRASGKYRRLKTMAYLEDSFFWDTHVFKKLFYKHQKQKGLVWRNLKYSNLRNRPFTVDLINEETNPPVMKGLSYNRATIQRIGNEFLKLQGKEIYFPVVKENLKEKVGTFEAEDITGKKYFLSLYKKYGSLNGYFLVNNIEESVFDLGEKASRLFFLSHQDFWELKAIRIGKDRRFAIQFPSQETHQLQINDGKSFSVSRVNQEGKAPKNGAFLQLFRFLTASAERVAELDPITQIKDHAQILLNWQQNPIRVIFKDNEVIARNEKDGYQLHYPIGESTPLARAEKSYFISP